MIRILAIVLSIVLLPSANATGEQRLWKFGAQGDWNDPANWREGVVPKEGDDVKVSGENSRPIISTRTPRLERILIERTIVFQGQDAVLHAEYIDLTSEGKLTLPKAVEKLEGAHWIQIVCPRVMHVGFGTSIDVSALGLLGGTGAGKDDDPTSAGFGPGAGGYPKIFGPSAGGSHGGRGGQACARDPYGSHLKPAMPGSGGGGGNGQGGAGGGVIRIEVGEQLFVDGLIAANGGDVTTRNWSGGGAGGSIHIKCGGLSGNGRIEANGGAASVYAGGGGGGRIAIDGPTNPTANRFPTVTALGGCNGRCGVGVEDPKHFGEPGTIWFSADAPPANVPKFGGVVVHGDQKPAPPKQRDTVDYFMPWVNNPPIVTVDRSIHRPHAKPHMAEMTSRWYVGPGLEMMETAAQETLDDVGENITARWSSDNGKSWSEPVDIQKSNNIDYGGQIVWEGGWANTYDPTSKRLVQMWLRQIIVDKLYHCFTYIRTSTDQGRTWSEPQQLTYEPGPRFDPKAPASGKFLNRNEGYPGNNILVRSDGTLAVALAHANDPFDTGNATRPWKMGSRILTGRWNAERSEYQWRPSELIRILPSQSARGLMEPEIAELPRSRLLIVWRGSDQGWDGTKATEPGRKWFSLSLDGGNSTTPPLPWRYDDGTSIYSSSSIHRMIRHSRTGKLYWIGNLSVGPPQGNSPRYPLLIAEVDDETGLLKKSTVTTIDDRDPNKHDFNFQLSNFSLYENRETHSLELFLTTYGQIPGQENWNTADSIRYEVTLRQP